MKSILFSLILLTNQFAHAMNLSTTGQALQLKAQAQCVQLRASECMGKCKKIKGLPCHSLCSKNVINQCRRAGE